MSKSKSNKSAMQIVTAPTEAVATQADVSDSPANNNAGKRAINRKSRKKANLVPWHDPATVKHQYKRPNASQRVTRIAVALVTAFENGLDSSTYLRVVLGWAEIQLRHFPNGKNSVELACKIGAARVALLGADASAVMQLIDCEGRTVSRPDDEFDHYRGTGAMHQAIFSAVSDDRSRLSATELQVFYLHNCTDFEWMLHEIETGISGAALAECERVLRTIYVAPTHAA